jgi:pilus assembly protein Flp/PilA
MITHEPRPRPSRSGRGSRRTRTRSVERGASAVEYGLLIAGIAALIAIAVFAFGGGSNGMFQDSCETIMVDTSVGSCD